MIERPRFRAHYYAEAAPGEGAFLLSEEGPTKLGGRAFEMLTPLLDGTRSVDDLLEELEGVVPAPEVLYALYLLEQRGYVEEGNGARTPDAAFWAAQGLAPAAARERLSGSRVSIESLGVATDALAELVARHGITIGEEEGELRLVATDEYLRPRLGEINRAALRHGTPWMLIKPVGAEVWIGPIFQPRVTGCWSCLAQRLRTNREIEVVFQQGLGRGEPLPIPRGASPASLAAAYALAVLQLARWLVRGGTSEPEGHVLSLDLTTGETRRHRLVRQPYCEDCGDPDLPSRTPLAPLVLQSRAKSYTADGGHRTATPEETLARFGHHTSRITGICGDLRRVDVDGEGVIHVYIAGDNRAVQNWSSDVLRVHFRSKSAGKGVTDAQARASGLCESIERFSGYFHGYERRTRRPMRALGGEAVHPNDCMQFSERQYRERAAWNARKSRFNSVPVPFDEDDAIEWTPVWSLTRNAPRYLPTGFCYFAYPMEPERAYFRADSNGNAAGNTIEEAVLQGFLELAERDAMGIWWYNRVRRPAVDVDAFGDPYPARLREILERRNRDLWVLDLTNDLKIPVFGAFSRVHGAATERITMGFGAHLEPRMALLRAVTELNQMLSWALPEEQGRADGRGITDPETLQWLASATVSGHPYLAPDEGVAPRRACDFPLLATDDLRDDVLLCQSIVERLGLELMVLDQTRPDIGLPVVKVSVPGLRHCHARLAPGRLYDVPVRLGWLDAPLSEEELNPIPIFL